MRFTIKFALIAAVGFVLYCFPYAADGGGTAFFDAYLATYARLAAAVLALFEPGLRVTGPVIVGRSSMAIVKNCDAMEVIILFSAALVAAGGPWRRASIALALGVAALVVLNLVRICSLYFFAVHVPGAFETIHLEVWPLLLVAFAVAEFVVCARWVRSAAKGAEHAVR